jgi:C-1 hydroxylase
MTIEQNKNLVNRVVELWNRRDLDAFFEVLSPEYIEHLSTGDVTLKQLKKYAGTFFTAFPDIKITVKEMVAEGDRVAALVNWKATHKGEYLGIPATGKKIDISVAMIIKIRAGKWVEFWNVTDIGLAEQLGAVPRG